MDRALFLPHDWAEDRERCRQAGVLDAATHRPKTELPREMLLNALDSGVAARWVTGDAVYGESFRLRWALEARGQGYVMAVSRKAHVWPGLHQR